MSLTDAEKQDTDYHIEPQKFNEFIGQEKIKENLNIYIAATLQRKEALDHIVFYGPPGLGKTTLSSIIAKQLNVSLQTIGAPSLSKVGDLVAILTNIAPYSVLFIDEIHRLDIKIEETLYSAMQNRTVGVVIGEGAGARTINIDLPPFTLIGATTRLGLLSKPLRDRFGITMKLEFYSTSEMNQILYNAIQRLNMAQLSNEILEKISLRSRGTPRVALRLLRRIRDFIDLDVSLANERSIEKIFSNLRIDILGLEHQDIKYLEYLYECKSPVGLNTICSAIAESKDSIQDMLEPYLIQMGFINRTSRGRILTEKGIEYINKYKSNLSSIAYLEK